jgi:hypothetical protein
LLVLDERADVVDDPSVDVLATERVASGRLPCYDEILLGSPQDGRIHSPAAEVIHGDVAPDRRRHGESRGGCDRFRNERGGLDTRLLDRLPKHVEPGGAPVSWVGQADFCRKSFSLLATRLGEGSAENGGHEVDDRNEAITEEDFTLADRPLRRGLEAFGIEDCLVESRSPDQKLLVLREEHRRRHA